MAAMNWVTIAPRRPLREPRTLMIGRRKVGPRPEIAPCLRCAARYYRAPHCQRGFDGDSRQIKAAPPHARAIRRVGHGHSMPVSGASLAVTQAPRTLVHRSQARRTAEVVEDRCVPLPEAKRTGSPSRPRRFFRVPPTAVPSRASRRVVTQHNFRPGIGGNSA